MANPTQVNATIAQYGAFIQGSDFLVTVAIDPLLTEYSEILGEQAGDSIDQITRDVLAAGTTVRYANGSTSRGDVSSGDVINTTEIRKLLRALEQQNARPVSGQDFALIIHPNTYYDLISDSTVVQAMEYAANRGNDNPLFTGEIGRYMGFVIIKSTNAKWLSGVGLSTSDVYMTLAIGRDAYGVTEFESGSVNTYFHPMGSAGTADPLNQVWTFGWKVAFGAVILNDNWMVRLEHAVSA